MISFTLLTNAPGRMATFLESQNIVQSISNAPIGSGFSIVGVLEGLEWVEVPNPIVTTLGNASLAAVMDTRHCYLVKVVRASETDQTSGFVQSDPTSGGGSTLRSILQRTRLGNWIVNNSVVTSLVSADGRSWPARQVGSGTNAVWGVISDDFGVWQ